MADPDDKPAEMSGLDLSEDTAITGEDVEETFGVGEGSEVRPNPDAESADEEDEE